MKPDEKFVMEAIKKAFGGEIHESDSPNKTPDAYLSFDGEKIAVEVTKLPYKIKLPSGEIVECETLFARTEHLVKELKTQLSDNLPPGCEITLRLRTPLSDKFRKPLSKLKVELMRMLATNSQSEVLNIGKYVIEVKIKRARDASSRNIRGFTSTSGKVLDIECNAKAVLRERIITKSKKCSEILHEHKVWLALLNTYELAENELYSRCFAMLNVKHPFARVLVVDKNQKVTVLF